MSSSRGLENRTPATIRITPLTRLKRTDVCTVSLTSSSFRAPYPWAVSTLVPMERPMNTLTIRLISALVEPTAASAWAPEKRPTTTISAALKSSCSTPESIRGKVKTRIFPNSGPLHISISYDFFKTHSSDFQISRMQTM